MKSRLMTLIAAVALALGCADAPRPKAAVDLNDHEGVETPKPTKLSASGWEITFPPHWSVKAKPGDFPKKEQVTIQTMAHTDRVYGTGPGVFVLATVDLSNEPKGEEGSFGEHYAAAIASDGDNVLSKVRPVMFDGRMAFLAMYVTKKHVTNVALLLEEGTTGYVLRCSVDSAYTSTVVPMCGSIIDSFALKK